MFSQQSLPWTEFSFALGVSSIEGGGIGVFATHNIKAGSPVLLNKFTARVMKTKDVPAPLLKYMIHLNDDECRGPERFDRMEIGWYINHSPEPNLVMSPTSFVAKRDIKAGDEILVDYDALGEPEHLKEDYYKAS